MWEHNGTYMCETCLFKSKVQNEVEQCEQYHKDLDSILHCTEFEITEQHLKLLQQQNVKFKRGGEYGATEIDPKHPYGNSYVEGDILEHTGTKGDIDDGDGSYSCSKELKKRLFRLHAETTVALQICMRFLKFETGKYERKPDWIIGEWVKKRTPCVYFRGIEDCLCNNDPDNPGECFYTNGIETEYLAITCKHYKAR